MELNQKNINHTNYKNKNFINIESFKYLYAYGHLINN